MLPNKWWLFCSNKLLGIYDLQREKYSCVCPYADSISIKDGEYNLCGSWCPLFEIHSTMYKVKSDIDAINETVDNGIMVTLHCGSGNAEYKIESIKGE